VKAGSDEVVHEGQIVHRCLRHKRADLIEEAPGYLGFSESHTLDKEWLLNNDVSVPMPIAVYGLNGHRLYYIISLFKVTYKSTIQVSRNFHALFTETLENSDTCD
jgi:hypothetical protein